MIDSLFTFSIIHRCISLHGLFRHKYVLATGGHGHAGWPVNSTSSVGFPVSSC